MIKKAFGDNSVNEVQIQLLYRRFNHGRESAESDSLCGRPSKSRTPENVERVRAANNKNRRLTAQELEKDVGIPRTIVPEIFTDYLGMKRVAENVPRPLSQKQKAFRAEVAQDLLETANNEPDFL
jgi:hypothetical protein